MHRGGVADGMWRNPLLLQIGYVVAASRTANDSRFATAERDIATPFRVGSKGDAASNCDSTSTRPGLS